MCPIDSAAPKGRLILPQVQTIREILDYKGLALVCQTEELPAMINSLKNPLRWLSVILKPLIELMS